MDFLGISRGSIRSKALDKLAVLSLSTTDEFDSSLVNGKVNGVSNGSASHSSSKRSSSSDFWKLADAISDANTSNIPISHKELEIIFALSNVSDSIQSYQQASDLFNVLSPYLLEAPSQQFRSNITFQLSPSPWDHLTSKLTKAIVQVTVTYPELKEKAIDLFTKYLSIFTDSSSLKLTGYFSLLGFLKALIESNLKFDTLLITKILGLINTQFLDNVEILISESLENERDYTYLLEYQSNGNEFSSLLFCKLVQQLSHQIILSIISNNEDQTDVLSYLLNVSAYDYDSDPEESSKIDQIKRLLDENLESVKLLTENSQKQIAELEEGSTYISLSSNNRVELAFEAKSYALQVLGAGLLINTIDKEFVIQTVQNSLAHESEILHKDLSPSIISLGSLLIYRDCKSISGDLIHTFPLIISNGALVDDVKFIQKISGNLALGLKPLDQDSIVTTIYSLVNLLSTGRSAEPITALRDLRLRSSRKFSASLRGRTNTLRSITSSTDLSEKLTDEGDKVVFQNAIQSIVEISKRYQDNSITVLAVTVLSQKFRKVSKSLDFALLDGFSSFAPILYPREFLVVMRLLDNSIVRAEQGKDADILNAVIGAKVKVARHLNGQFENPLYKVFLNELLASGIARGDVQNAEHHRSHVEISEVGQQISYTFKPLASLLPQSESVNFYENDNDTINLFRNFWFNLVVHGYTESSPLTIRFKKELEVIALSSPPLASELPRVHAETSFELNTVLRRGSSNHNVKDQKHIVGGFSNTNSLELRTLSYPKLMFLSATSLLENLRTNVGDFTTILQYFSDPAIANSVFLKFIGSIAISITQKFIKLTAQGGSEHFTSSKVAQQLNKILVFCCHRNYDLQDAAFQVADLFLSKIPSALCHRNSLFTLLDILTLLFDSVIDSGRNKYQPQRVFLLKHSKVEITLTDSSKWRNSTLERFQSRAKPWCQLSLHKSNQDMKSLLQAYISDLGLFERLNGVDLGVSFAVELAGTILPTDSEVANLSTVALRNPNSLAGFLSQYGWRARNLADQANVVGSQDLVNTKNLQLAKLKKDISEGVKISDQRLIDVLDIIATVLILRQDENDRTGLIHELVTLPFNYSTSDSMKVATNIWLGIIKERQDDLSYLLLSEIVICWQNSIKSHRGLFSREYDLTDEGFLKMSYSPSNEAQVNYQAKIVSDHLQIHLHVIRFFSSHFQGTLFESDHLLKIFTTVIFDGLDGLKIGSVHPFARLIRSQFISFSLEVLQLHQKTKSHYVYSLTDSILDGVLSWFINNPHFPFGGNILKIKTDVDLLIEIFKQIGALSVDPLLAKKKELVIILLSDEINKSLIWLSPTNPREFKSLYNAGSEQISYAYHLEPDLAFALVDRYPELEKHLKTIIQKSPLRTIRYQKNVKYLLASPQTYKYLILSKPISPTDSINLFQPPYFDNPYVIQYNMRSLESHDINLTFFYVPQIVQSLRNDSLGYVGRLIVETGKVNQLFAHQIIWNILANRYKDEEATIEDPIKSSLDYVMNKLIESFSPRDLEFYQTEFKFFNEVTDISGKLKPYIKKTKAEKKVKIDEEMKKIEVAENVYLPSNPDGVVIDINRSSGKPLQSHAKAPFMATFKIHKQEISQGQEVTIEKWQSAIFKVGDDCRQDVLALQLISIFKSIWENCGLDLYCFPYRVTATAPGCGVIDVLPNSVSRDMLGREAVNGLYEYFTTKFGGENSVEFENARNNFVKSLAAYSIISYLLQFKDRHNGNIMYDDQGHILHIDFGFCFDIAPGGVTFEAVPFKLTKEMVKVMGGSNETESFKMFEELFIKGFLSARPYCELIVGNVIPMLGSGLPCFKGEKTIKNLRNRFFLNKSEKEVIYSLKHLIKKSYESMYTVGYDKFQKMTNGIPF